MVDPPSLPVHVRATRTGRIVDYLGEMFPAGNGILAFVNFLAVYLGLEAICRAGVLRLPWKAAAGGVSVALAMLLFRVTDELKDVDSDRRLAAAGDPRYATRPIVTGRVTVDDLVALRSAVTIALLVTNLLLGVPWPFLFVFVLYAVVWLSSKWFFIPKISESLLLAFVTHNPLGLLLQVYIAAIYLADFGREGLRLGAATLLLVGVYLPLAAWETSRKLRVPEDETDYETYTKVLGLRVAPLLPIAFVAGSLVCVLEAARAAGLGLGFQAVLAASALVPIGGAIRFLVWPGRAAANLRPAVELFAAVTWAGLPIAIAVERGVVPG
jgi:4-hydroxybenzoate polyprenyltransferase